VGTVPVTGVGEIPVVSSVIVRINSPLLYRTCAEIRSPGCMVKFAIMTEAAG
jgi:hypothetical protein